MTYEEPVEGSLVKYQVWYPADMKGTGARYPVIVSNNGTGWPATKYTQWFRHMASWGFIVVGNEEGTSWNGKSAEQTLTWLLSSERSPNSIFHNHVDRSKIGLIGHSQGGTGVVNAATVQPSASLYKTAVMLSSTHDGYNSFLRWTSDASKLSIPTLLLVAKNDGLTPPEALEKIYDAIPRTVFKAKGRRIEGGHGDMLVAADGYVTAWMMWQLKGDKNASNAFVGANPELATNKTFIDVEISRP
jgi:fermentation-respiration switch protein FrsA (DUF1100 family)